MPIKQSAMKALRQTRKRTLRNAAVKDNVAYLRRMLRKALESKDAKVSAELIRKVVKALDKAAQNNVLKKNTVSRTKSRLMRAVNALSKK
ncbi:hypothetical protein A3C96_01480 [Candidatus Uhrbacteria bacterium RIFCSPHIGHO2_02_FULL_60_10]|uniref:Small ribosomal subunit protein bS20 n=1 Tax=Candidatus Uhrbacteria bacterium RIFCSPHIGHO2_02_FULL_60_10 TaxID=1802392 RepID=A0A1F7U9X9_9BACT|nr:MAG: hypothetical protein A3C96_01480 [Candidatus Uhrbacteria bacterium RIFCSPHIGHO2_02_FULL_60_10]